MLELLLKAGADPTARMYGGRTPLGSALLRPNPILARLLRAHGAPEPEDEDDKLSPCSSSGSDSDSDNRDEGVSLEWVSQLEGQGKPATRNLAGCCQGIQRRGTRGDEGDGHRLGQGWQWQLVS